MSAIPPDIRLIAAVSRLIDIHQSRREAGGAYVPDVPDKAGLNLFIAIQIIEVLHEIEVDRGVGFCPISELTGRLRKRMPDIATEELEDVIANLRHGREIHYGQLDEMGGVTYARTWDTTPLVDIQEGFSQIQLTENARLLLRVSSLRESWLYSDLDANRLIKAIERGQFQDVPSFCRAMTLDLATKSKQLSEIMERPALTELRMLLIEEGSNISDSLNAAAATTTQAIDLVFSDHVATRFAAGAYPFHLGNLQADLELVLQNVESLSRRFLNFITVAQQVRNEGTRSIQFLRIAEGLVRDGDESQIRRTEALLADLLPWGVKTRHFHPSMLIGQTDLKPEGRTDVTPVMGYTLDPVHAGPPNRFIDFVRRNREQVIAQLRQGPVSFAEMMAMTGFTLEDGESPMDFFGVYSAPGLLDSDDQRIIVGLTADGTRFEHERRRVIASDPVMYLEKTQ